MKTAILDTRGLIIRAWAVGKDPSAVIDEETGKPVNSAAYGVNNFLEHTLVPLLEEYSPLDIIAVWDVGASKYRTAIYPEYKSNRKKSRESEPAEMKAQRDLCIRYVKNILTRLGVMSVHCQDVEADDVIARLCPAFPGEILVDTVDADLLQLQADHPNVKVRRGGEIIEDGFYKALPIEYTTLNKSIVGDSSDGYGGIKGLGPAAWDTLFAEFGDDGLQELEEIIKNGDRATLQEVANATAGTPVGKHVAKMVEQFSDWQVMYCLAQLHPELCEGFYNGKMNTLTWTARLPQLPKLKEALELAGCQHYLPTLQKHCGAMRLVTADKYDAALAHFKAHALTGPVVGFDVESFDTLKHEPYQRAKSGSGNFVDMAHQQLTGWSLCYGPNLQYTLYVSCGHRDTDNVPMEKLNEMLSIADEAGLAIQNATFETVVVGNNTEYEIVDPYDTAVMSSYVNENLPSGLKDLSLEYLRYQQITYKEVLEAAGAEDMAGLTGQEVMQYGGDDAYVTARLFWLFARTMWVEDTIDFYAENELGTYRSFLDAYTYGVPIDFARMAEIKASDDVKLAEADKNARALLADHCSDPAQYDEDSVAELVEDLMTFERAKLQEKVQKGELTPDEADGKAQSTEARLTSTFLELAPYQEFARELKVPEFKPTAAQLSKVAAWAGLSEVPSVSLSGLNAYVASEFDRLGELKKTEDTALAERALTLIAAAAHQLKARSGAEYEALKSFVEGEVYIDSAKEVTRGSELKPGSPQQMQALFYVTLGFPILVRSKPSYGSSRDRLGLKGAPGTDAKTIETLIAEYGSNPEDEWRVSILKELKEQRRLMTRSQLFFTPYPLWENPDEPGLVNPQFKNCGTVTRRPSGSAPNFLQISKKDPDIRQLIVAPEGYVCVSPDYNGQELRIMGSESQDPVFLDAYLGPERKDIHSVTASGIAYAMASRNYPDLVTELAFEGGLLSYEAFTSALHSNEEYIRMFAEAVRKAAKAVNFLIIYGGGPETLARNLGIPVEVAKAFIQAFFLRYPRVTPWQNSRVSFAQKHGYALTAYGNRRHLPDIHDANRALAARAERQSVNFPIQGCLQSGSLVWTDGGQVPIEKLVGTVFMAYTGFSWETATAVDMGEARLAEVELSSGLKVRCDIRHKFKNTSREWVEFNDLKVGDSVALPRLNRAELDCCDYHVDWPFVLGYWLGDGCMTTRKGSRSTDKHLRTTFKVCGADTKKEIVEQIHEFLLSEGLVSHLRASSKGRGQVLWYVEVNRKEDIEVLRAAGITELTSLEKRVPDSVWTMNSRDSESFLKGFLLSDGARRAGHRVHTPNTALLDDLQKLYAYMQVDSWRGETSTGEYVEMRAPSGGNRLYPGDLLREDLGGQVLSSRKGDARSIVDRRASLSGQVTQGVAERIYDWYAPDKEVYRYDQVTSIRVLDEVSHTYTLSVDHPLHQFVADGVVHKNCAADILKVALRHLRESKLLEDTGAFLAAPVYDETFFFVPKEEVVPFWQALKPIMDITPPGHQIPMEAELSIGHENWGDLIELGGNPSTDAILAACDGVDLSKEAA